MSNAPKTVTYRCENGHAISLVLDSRLANAVKARRDKNGTCEVGVGGGNVCCAPLLPPEARVPHDSAR